ncbi:MAG: rhodanese-like domain-containing protein [Methylomonas sp.]|jgi:rhodanese-related sulfurtransferase|uniref:rhodanese-like domain-containing protein n=1 Tax=Methylomonas sp. TaxID=418 RepID=UPI0025DDCC85|nr:rhodanese-like domain-containing protein [Methylomonas sp.]MCK9607179.1 rhodanese-like domain-containing protein [Methylomonas sp.]
MPITQCTVQYLQERLQKGDTFLLLDVREPNEYAFAHIDGSIHIPLNQIPERMPELNSEQDIVVVCHHGMRSQQACLFLEQYGFNQLYNLKGGIDAWSVSCDPTVPRY